MLKPTPFGAEVVFVVGELEADCTVFDDHSAAHGTFNPLSIRIGGPKSSVESIILATRKELVSSKLDICKACRFQGMSRV